MKLTIIPRKLQQRGKNTCSKTKEELQVSRDYTQREKEKESKTTHFFFMRV